MNSERNPTTPPFGSRAISYLHEAFLRPRKLSQLLTAVRDGPIVTLNISKMRCDALILMPNLEDVLHIHLNDFSHKHARLLHSKLKKLLGSGNGRTVDNGSVETKVSHDVIRKWDDVVEYERILSSISTSSSTRKDEEFPTTHRHLDGFEFILSELWHRVVKPVLDGLVLTVCCRLS